MASEVRADAEVAEDVAGIVDETDEGTGRSGAGDGTETEPAPAGRAVPSAAESAESAESDASAEKGTPAELAESGESAAAESVVPGATASEATAQEATAPEAVEQAAPRGKRRILIVLIFAALALTVDAVSKALVVAKLQDRPPYRVPGGFLDFNLIRNPGAAFNIGEGQTWVFTFIAAGVVFVILRVARNLRSLPWAIALGLLLGGALGNLSDRLFRSPGVGRGDVVDFLQIRTFPLVHYDFPVFNLADSSIVIGGCLMVLLSFLGMQPDGTRQKDTAPAQATSEDPKSQDQA
ncbi:signal peptidase II [Catenulispora sp. NL8]|uniref:Lipoprotein signal peptidase n=1 Tax=Catenulispora pinistramenti TaxID=2705254 RepID=A0ABS5KW90_9ACTN|nr:signal peptidase II [Catenulispora pinistramenti]MBS2550341.1 signal peptidase II [Catenulispora pinistramenti]